MPKTFEAVYEAGVLRPLESLELSEHQHVQVTIAEVEEVPADLAGYFEPEEWKAALRDPITHEEVRDALSTIPGSLADDIIAAREDRI